MKYELRGNDIIKHEDGKEFILVDKGFTAVFEEIKPAVKTLTCVFQPDAERTVFTRFGQYEITRETKCFWWVKDNNGYPNRKISKRTMREAGYKEAYAAEFQA